MYISENNKKDLMEPLLENNNMLKKDGSLNDENMTQAHESYSDLMSSP